MNYDGESYKSESFLSDKRKIHVYLKCIQSPREPAYEMLAKTT